MKLNALIVEDDLAWEPLWKYILGEVAEEPRYTWATNELTAEEAIEDGRKNGSPFDVIICDIFISGSKTGLDLLERYSDLKNRIILASAVDKETLLSYLGPDGRKIKVLQKPFGIADCVSMIKSILHVQDPRLKLLPQ